MPKKPNRHKRGRIWKVKNTSQRKTEGRYRKCYTPHTLDIFLFHCTSWLRNTPCKRITIYIKRPTYTLSVYQNKLPALDDFLITFLMKANFQNKIHMKLLETVNRSNFPGGSDSKESAFNAGNLGSIPGFPGSPGTGTGIRLQYGCLENPMDREPGGLQSTRSQRVRHNLATEHKHKQGPQDTLL